MWYWGFSLVVWLHIWTVQQCEGFHKVRIQIGFYLSSRPCNKSTSLQRGLPKADVLCTNLPSVLSGYSVEEPFKWGNYKNLLLSVRPRVGTALELYSHICLKAYYKIHATSLSTSTFPWSYRCLIGMKPPAAERLLDLLDVRLDFEAGKRTLLLAGLRKMYRVTTQDWAPEMERN